jgi:hypothetical protein
MGENSRVKKYEDLRNSLQQEQDDEKIVQQALEGFDKAQNKVQDNDTESKEYQPSHGRRSDSEHLVEKTGEFKNEYLDNFIQEVRDYNIKKGVRENDDTRLDILQQLSTKQRKKRASYMEQVDEQLDKEVTPSVDQYQSVMPEVEPEVVDEDAMANTQSIAKQVQELLAAEREDAAKQAAEVKPEPVPEPVHVVDPLEDTIQSLKTTDTSAPIYTDEDEDDFDITSSLEEQELMNQQLLDETLKLRTQLNEYEEELTTLNDGVDKNNRLLNIIITVLIVMLFAVIAVVGYWLVSGGIL